MRSLQERINRKKRQIETLDAYIGRLMSQRVDHEDALAALYEQQRNSSTGAVQ